MLSKSEQYKNDLEDYIKVVRPFVNSKIYENTLESSFEA